MASKEDKTTALTAVYSSSEEESNYCRTLMSNSLHIDDEHRSIASQYSIYKLPPLKIAKQIEGAFGVHP